MMTMIETNPVRFYLARFSFLAFALTQWLSALFIFFFWEPPNEGIWVAAVFLLFGAVFLWMFKVVNDKVKKVAIGRNKIVVTEGDHNFRFKWPEVKSVKTFPFLRLYRLKLRGKKPIYFFPSREIEQTFGDVIVGKRP